mmetsp:Transcript_23103/g.53089  ORF Transcript_23103/g.53089 Transcript_23103/m.53089 type:complete len:237 (-) Transcript_23103:1830-2540(-)
MCICCDVTRARLEHFTYACCPAHRLPFFLPVLFCGVSTMECTSGPFPLALLLRFFVLPAGLACTAFEPLPCGSDCLLWVCCPFPFLFFFFALPRVSKACWDALRVFFDRLGFTTAASTPSTRASTSDAALVCRFFFCFLRGASNAREGRSGIAAAANWCASSETPSVGGTSWLSAWSGKRGGGGGGSRIAGCLRVCGACCKMLSNLVANTSSSSESFGGMIDHSFHATRLFSAPFL